MSEQRKAIRIEGICKSSQKVCFLSHLVSDGRENRQVATLFLYKRFHGWTRGAGFLQNQIQLEFCFRDGKQHAGITNCQSTDFRKLDFHFNASLAAINLAKAACKRLGITYSISSCKSFIHNAYMLERFICVFGINPDPQVIDKLFKELILFTARAA